MLDCATASHSCLLFLICARSLTTPAPTPKLRPPLGVPVTMFECSCEDQSERVKNGSALYEDCLVVSYCQAPDRGGSKRCRARGLDHGGDGHSGPFNEFGCGPTRSKVGANQPA